MKKILILGGIASGKSAYAEKLAISANLPKLYIATATNSDGEMAARIMAHQSRRDDSWQVIEEGVEIAKLLRDRRWQGHVILVDCLTLWLSNIMGENMAQRRAELCDAVRDSEANIIMVSNETGLGGVPINAVARRFGDEAGLLHQQLAEICDTVALVAAGLPMFLKSSQ